ncbi:MAG TPA: D-glycero-beta-D-manno-heptose-7-phosphate kinase [Candidatus Polarisedimenticolia bacterium]|nr:D-glycero-beta-D-manno-heptose-7-phosphate kinase [Candidatus Polarisedimenticolia bacterium]
MSLSSRAARSILAGAASRKIVVLGDLMLDQFIWGTVERISPEAPVPVVRVARESAHLGGAGNVVSNLAALGAGALPVGLAGNDDLAARLRQTLGAIGVDHSGVLEAPGRVTTIKTRIVAHHQQVVRFDREQDDAPGPEVIDRLSAAALERVAEADALIVSDYEKGCVTPRLLEVVLPQAARRGLPVVVDPKPAHWRSYRPITAITPNQLEAARMAGSRPRTEQDLIEAGTTIRRALGCKGVLLTRGEKGMLLIEEGEEPLAIPAAAREVFDVTGAGDTVIAALALGLAAGAPLRDAAALANAAAGVVVGKLGTATATPAEVLAGLEAGPAS